MYTNKAFCILILICSLLISCKKDTKVEPTNSGPSERYKMITSHYWRLAKIWQDTTTYGKENPNLIPLPTSVSVWSPSDSCQYYSCSYYSANGWYYYIRRPGCNGCGGTSDCIIKDGAPWSLSADEQTFNGPYNIDKIIVVNDSAFKRYNIQIYNFTKTLINVYEFEVYKLR